MDLIEAPFVRWLRNGLAVIALILAVIVTIDSAHSRALQDRANAGREDLAKAQTFANLDNGVVRLIAKTAAEKNDAALRDLLARNGVTFQVQAPAAAASGGGAGQ